MSKIEAHHEQPQVMPDPTLLAAMAIYIDREPETPPQPDSEQHREPRWIGRAINRLLVRVHGLTTLQSDTECRQSYRERHPY